MKKTFSGLVYIIGEMSRHIAHLMVPSSIVVMPKPCIRIHLLMVCMSASHMS